jgi:hypothetical protein
MTGLGILLLAAAASAFGAWASLKSRPPLWAAAAAALLFAVAGICAVLASWIVGDGVVLPGLQLSPGLKATYFAEVRFAGWPWVGRALLLLAPLAHLLVLVARRDRWALLRPAPATALFLGLFLWLGGEEDAWRFRVVQARGPDGVGYLTIATRPEGTRMILAAGAPFASFLRVLHVHEATIPPPVELHLYWTNDGRGLVVRVHEEEKAIFAVDLDGAPTGMLPADRREWARRGEFVPPDVQERLSRARRDVAEFVVRHGNLYPP